MANEVAVQQLLDEFRKLLEPNHLPITFDNAVKIIVMIEKHAALLVRALDGWYGPDNRDLHNE